MKGKGENGIYGPRWPKLYRYMKENQLGVAALQETHLTDSDLQWLETNDRFKVFASSLPGHESRAAGVAIVINKSLVSLEDVEVKIIIPGRAISVTFQWHVNLRLTVLNIYAPSRTELETRTFLEDLLEAYTSQPTLTKPDLLVGDFNMVEAAHDRSSSEGSSQATVSVLWNLKRHLGLLDAHLAKYPDSRAVIYRSDANPNYWERLDRAYIKNNLIDWIMDSRVEDTGVESDHRAMVTTLECRRAPYIGKGRWSMPVRLLKSRPFIQKIDACGKAAQERLQAITARTDQLNPQIVLRDFKAEVKQLAREYDKIVKPRSDEQAL
ncbi:DNase I-like protein, partial [Peniophora sp. CONT]